MKRRFWRRTLLIFVVLWLVVHGFGGEVDRVRSHSMEPTLHDGQRVLVNRVAYGLRWLGGDDWLLEWGTPRVGDVVIVRAPTGERLVKRIVAITADGYDVRGDNPAHSTDSRHFGLVARRAIIGRVVGDED